MHPTNENDGHQHHHHAAHLADTVKKVETIVSRLRVRSSNRKSSASVTSSASTSNSMIDPKLSLVDKARMIKTRASRIARLVQDYKSDETTSSSESYSNNRSTTEVTFAEDYSGVTWYKGAYSFDDCGEI